MSSMIDYMENKFTVIAESTTCMNENAVMFLLALIKHSFVGSKSHNGE